MMRCFRSFLHPIRLISTCDILDFQVISNEEKKCFFSDRDRKYINLHRHFNRNFLKFSVHFRWQSQIFGFGDSHGQQYKDFYHCPPTNPPSRPTGLLFALSHYRQR